MKSKAVIKKEQLERAEKMATLLSKFDLFEGMEISITPSGTGENYPELDQERKEFFKLLGEFRTIKELLG